MAEASDRSPRHSVSGNLQQSLHLVADLLIVQQDYEIDVNNSVVLSREACKMTIRRCFGRHSHIRQ